eukprot:TRINITY_DN10348_c0_g2_i1.p2 TRINITY_DN10348_c0_g2~~TRINITY_DN10348_c0_g2_i1.p2  ORF type:complete len:127 (+),score=16.39 TRINITY_DN10348_c0_g2_i1:55-435(+)
MARGGAVRQLVGRIPRRSQVQILSRYLYQYCRSLIIMKSIYVGNIPFSTSEDDLRDLFAQHGEVISVKFIEDRETGRFRGFGFVEMADAGAASAIEALDGHNMGGRPLKVNEAKPRAPRPRHQPGV